MTTKYMRVSAALTLSPCGREHAPLESQSADDVVRIVGHLYRFQIMKQGHGLEHIKNKRSSLLSDQRESDDTKCIVHSKIWKVILKVFMHWSVSAGTSPTPTGRRRNSGVSPGNSGSVANDC